jgi:hypothetical protein
MQTSRSVQPPGALLASFVALAISFGITAAAAEESPAQDTSAALQRLERQLDEQTKRIDRIYRLIGPNLAELEERAAELEKQQQEDKALALEQIRQVKDESLTAIG